MTSDCLLRLWAELRKYLGGRVWFFGWCFTIFEAQRKHHGSLDLIAVQKLLICAKFCFYLWCVWKKEPASHLQAHLNKKNSQSKTDKTNLRKITNLELANWEICTIFHPNNPKDPLSPWSFIVHRTRAQWPETAMSYTADVCGVWADTERYQAGRERFRKMEGREKFGSSISIDWIMWKWCGSSIDGFGFQECGNGNGDSWMNQNWMINYWFIFFTLIQSFPSRKNFDCVPWISFLQQFDSIKNKPSTSTFTSHMKECHDFDFSHQNHPWFIHPELDFFFCKAASAAQIQEAEQLLGREHFVEAERAALHHGERTNGCNRSTVEGANLPGARFLSLGKSKRLKWYVKDFHEEKCQWWIMKIMFLFFLPLHDIGWLEGCDMTHVLFLNYQ